jgi:pyruvate kinase
MAKNGTLIKINNEYWANTDNIFKGNPKTIMMRLFKNTTVKANEKLTPKTQVIDIDQRRQTEAIVKVYKKLQELKIIERKGSNGGYYALKALTEKDINDLEDKYFTKKEGFIYNKQPYMGAK